MQVGQCLTATPLISLSRSTESEIFIQFASFAGLQECSQPGVGIVTLQAESHKGRD